MRKILFFLLFFSYGIAGITYASWPVSDVSSTSTEAILPTSSGVFTTEYSIKWCTPTYKDYLSVYHQNNLDTDVSNFAKEFCYVGKLMPNGDLPEGGVSPIFTGGVPNLLGALVDGTDFQLKGQGIIDITTTVIDHAGNASTENFTYKIDKSAPEFGGISLLSGIDVVENSQYIHALETETIGGTQVKRNQVHFVDPANIDGILHNPTHASGIASDNAQVRTYTDDFMRKIRYKQTGSDIFDLNFEVDDTWHRAPVTAGFFSGNKNIEIYKAGTTGIIFPVTGTGISLGHGNFSLAPNTGQVYIARAYDNAGNFTEEPFYIFRDETEIDASKIKLTFEGDDSDVVLNNQESRFILADNDVKINYDWGTAFDTNDHMPTGIKMYVERHNDTSSFLSEDMSSSSSGTTQGYNLSFVDNEIKNSITGENFREYTVRFETPTFSGNHICDAVGNCISGEDVLKNLRVISAPVS
ncbi:MAG: hypothetical protein GY828_04290 [Candidatus Gracilibacteria bacterium]|nr:hypothetical protein [Candidatus Gracilibacteria bacterium]